MVLTGAGAVVAPQEQEETTMGRNETNAVEMRELTDAGPFRKSGEPS